MAFLHRSEPPPNFPSFDAACLEVGPWRMCRRHPTCRQPPRRCIVVLAAWRAAIEQFLGRLKDGSSRHFVFDMPATKASMATLKCSAMDTTTPYATSASAIIANAKQHTREHSAVFLVLVSGEIKTELGT